MDGEDPAPSTDDRAGRVLTVDLDWRTAMGAAIAFVAAVALFGAASTARNALTWIVLGFLFALALEPVVGRVEQLLGRR
jgi:predicted cobalt transporter CbtA